MELIYLLKHQHLQAELERYNTGERSKDASPSRPAVSPFEIVANAGAPPIGSAEQHPASSSTELASFSTQELVKMDPGILQPGGHNQVTRSPAARLGDGRHADGHLQLAPLFTKFWGMQDFCSRSLFP